MVKFWDDNGLRVCMIKYEGRWYLTYGKDQKEAVSYMNELFTVIVKAVRSKYRKTLETVNSSG
jgi:hypothetical protein